MLALATALVVGMLGPGFAVAAEPVTHTVAQDETLSSIAQRYGVPLDALVMANGLTDPNQVQPGQRLLIPAVNQPMVHQVAAGETLFQIARRYHVSLEAILAANHLSDPDLIVVGQVITIPGSGDQGGSATPPQPSTHPAESYVVAAGDTLFRIAAKAGISIDAIVQANGLQDPNAIQVGQRLLIPTNLPRTPSSRGGERPPASASAAQAPAQTPSTAPGQDLGVFRISYYCLQGRMSSGRWVYQGAVAADPSVLPLGARVTIAGLGDYTVEDRFAVDLGQKRLDVWTASCPEALARGYEYRNVMLR